MSAATAPGQQRTRVSTIEREAGSSRDDTRPGPAARRRRPHRRAAAAVAAGALLLILATVPAGAALKGTFSAQGGHDYVQDFSRNLASWPTAGGSPSSYPGFCAYPDGTSGKYYPSKVVSVHNGVLDFYDHDSMGAAILPFCETGFTYGTWTVRMRQSGAYPGYHNAFLLWPNDGTWPAAGEFDFPEGQSTASYPYVAVVQPDASFLPATTTRVRHSWNDGAFHDYTMQWGPGFLRTYQDGLLVASVTSNIPDKAMHPVLQNEFSDTLTDPAKPSRSDSGHVYVDRVTYDRSYTIPPAGF